jgi:hypothetical protein
MRRFIVALSLLCAARAAPEVVDCDIAIVGGSLASAAAALAAANASSPATLVCFFELTDWPGGQLTSGGVSAVDFGNTWNFPANTRLTRAFAELLFESGVAGLGAANPGRCSVSNKCFLPEPAAQWLLARMRALPNLRVFLNTALRASATDASGALANLTLVQRTPAPGSTGWERPLSAALADWYSPAPSAAFAKRTLLVPRPRVVIEASEFGDVLMTAGLPAAQGIELPGEGGDEYDTGCGQAATVNFFVGWGAQPAPRPDPTPAGSDGGVPFWLDDGPEHYGGNWSHAMTWRRSLAGDPAAWDEAPGAGDVFMICSENDLPNAVLWLPLPAARAQAAAGAWAGGINLTALAMGEARAFGWYHYLLNASVTGPAPVPAARRFLAMNASAAGTGTGLGKMPYLRESRRAAAGLGGFRLCHWPLAAMQPPTPNCSLAGAPRFGGATYHWSDTVGIGAYAFDIHWLNASFCARPGYFPNEQPEPGAGNFFFPFRALTHAASPNLLLAGKSIAQSFYANSVTRLHPGEFATGTAAGAAAALIVRRGWASTGEALANVGELQALLETLGQPLTWE